MKEKPVKPWVLGKKNRRRLTSIDLSMVPGAGLEPAQRERRGILNPLCLPISPPGHKYWRRVPESNRTRRICNPLHNRFVNAPKYSGLSDQHPQLPMF